MTFQEFMEYSREFRSRHLKPIGLFLLKMKLKANHLTTISFIFGLLAAYYLFQDNLLFTIFLISHLVVDGLDGVVARLSQQTTLGKYYDHISDQLIVILFLFKIYLLLNDYYVLVMIFLTLITYLIHFATKMKYPVIYVRSGTSIALLFYPLLPNLIPPGTFLVVGSFIIYSLIQQLIYFLNTKKL